MDVKMWHCLVRRLTIRLYKAETRRLQRVPHCDSDPHNKTPDRRKDVRRRLEYGWVVRLRDYEAVAVIGWMDVHECYCRWVVGEQRTSRGVGDDLAENTVRDLGHCLSLPWPIAPRRRSGAWKEIPGDCQAIHDGGVHPVCPTLQASIDRDRILSFPVLKFSVLNEALYPIGTPSTEEWRLIYAAAAAAV